MTAATGLERASRFDARGIAVAILVPIVAIVLALAIGGIVVVIAGADPLAAYAELFRGAVGTPSNLSATIARSVPIVITGLGMGFAFRAGAFNIGGEGQMIVGALAGATIGVAFAGLPWPLLIVLVVIAGSAAGGALAWLPGWWQVRFEVPLLITTLLLNYIAALFAAYLVTYPLRDLAAGGLAETRMIPESIQLPWLFDEPRLHIGLVVALLLPLALAWFQRRTVMGYVMRITGLNPRFAEYGGVNMPRTIFTTMAISGAICGLAGVVQVLGVNYRYVDGTITSAGYAWSGFTAALLAAANPLYTVIGGVFLGALDVGAAGMERRTSVPLQLVDVVKAAIILMIAVRLAIAIGLRRILRVPPTAD
jgi:general nucleoside transport system permease protein